MPSPLVEKAVLDALDHQNALLKFISPNDTGKTGGHQCGYYLPKSIWRSFTANPPIKGKNSEGHVEILWQDGRTTHSCIKWYGTGTRSEYRLTRFGRDFPYLSQENVGDLLVLIRADKAKFIAYVLESPDDIQDLQASLGVEVSNRWAAYAGPGHEAETEDDCVDRMFSDFATDLDDFPGTSDFSNYTLKTMIDCLPKFSGLAPDNRLMMLMDKEYSLFKRVERRLCQDEISARFSSIDDFLTTAARIMNRRKSRAGRSLENHVGYLLKDSGVPFSARPNVDGAPDIIIPGKAEYEDPQWPVAKLFAVGVKTTCKDRWRQVLNEAKRIPRKYILTLQQGISGRQLAEMRDSGVVLVVPKTLHSLFPAVEGMPIQTVKGFVETVHRTLGP